MARAAPAAAGCCRGGSGEEEEEAAAMQMPNIWAVNVNAVRFRKKSAKRQRGEGRFAASNYRMDKAPVHGMEGEPR